ncbi:M-phase phosphoprotein 6 isoform X2 [Sorex araneus]|uniref:M-phase phosphoprotein 6 isoform X2 n=1 Tax=Sorex araneus TaxID=42254 RepID=UPI0024337CFB|nr:M-phase phosphoprotein 6 isoform X2 [Sorex araneus]
MAAERKTKLSKNLLRMKFMQRGLDSETKKQLEEEEKKIISEEHWYLDLPELKEKESFIIEEQSFLLCEDLLYGRMSFRGFNPEVEVLFPLIMLKITGLEILPQLLKEIAGMAVWGDGRMESVIKQSTAAPGWCPCSE